MRDNLHAAFLAHDCFPWKMKVDLLRQSGKYSMLK